MFMGEETGGKTLAAKDWSSRALMSTVVPRKTTGEFVSKRVVAFMKELGCEMSVVTLKTTTNRRWWRWLMCGEGAGELRRPADYHGE